MEWAQVSRDVFMRDEFRQSAVIRQLEIAGKPRGGSRRPFGARIPPLKRAR